MAERKYRFKRPNGQQETIEAILEELTLSPKEGDFRPVETLKDQMSSLVQELRRAREKRQAEKERDDHNANFAMAFWGIISLLFLFNAFGRAGTGDWLDQHRFEIKLFGIFLATIFLGVSIERSEFFKCAWAFGFTKLVTGIAFSAMVVVSTGKASSLINNVFSADASAFPFTRAIVTGLLVFQYAYPLLTIVALFSFLHLLSTAGWIHHTVLKKDRYEELPLQSTLFLILGIIILTFCARWVNTDFADTRWPKKIYRLAHVVDFNSNYACTNLRTGMSVIFLGQQQERVLIDLNSPRTEDLETFVDGELSENVTLPSQFFVMPCNYVYKLAGRQP